MKINYYQGQTNIVGPKIKKYRKHRQFTQAELAIKMQLENIDISQKTVSRIETGKRFVTDYEVLVFSKVLCVDVSELMDLI